MGRSRYVGTVSEDLLAVLATLTPSARAMLRQTLLRDGDNPGAASRIWVSGHQEGGDDYLLDNLVYKINRRTLDPTSGIGWSKCWTRSMMGLRDPIARYLRRSAGRL